jgi:hypothetical protein
MAGYVAAHRAIKEKAGGPGSPAFYIANINIETMFALCIGATSALS